jgi:hypothetical protein
MIKWFVAYKNTFGVSAFAVKEQEEAKVQAIKYLNENYPEDVAKFGAENLIDGIWRDGGYTLDDDELETRPAVWLVEWCFADDVETSVFTSRAKAIAAIRTDAAQMMLNNFQFEEEEENADHETGAWWGVYSFVDSNGEAGKVYYQRIPLDVGLTN